MRFLRLPINPSSIWRCITSEIARSHPSLHTCLLGANNKMLYSLWFCTQHWQEWAASLPSSITDRNCCRVMIWLGQWNGQRKWRMGVNLTVPEGCSFVPRLSSHLSLVQFWAGDEPGSWWMKFDDCHVLNGKECVASVTGLITGLCRVTKVITWQIN